MNHPCVRAPSLSCGRVRPAVMVILLAAGLGLIPLAFSAQDVPNEIKQPGTQPGEVGTFTSVDNCDNCHGGIWDPRIPPSPWRASRAWAGAAA